MGIISDALNKKSVPVFGTNSYTYNTAEFDRTRDDGFSVIDLMPECRVFVGGAEITKDVITTSVNHEMSGGIGGGSTGGGSQCTITLANPKGKFEITKTDLTGKWREDKDVLAMYDYTSFDKDKGFDLKNALWNFLDSQQLANVATDTIKGISGSPIVGAIGGAALSHGLKALKNSNVPKSITRMLYEVKHVSGLYKQIGDIVFDYKDPVYVFMKGRFSPLWYFAFSGIVSNWTESESYGDSSTVSLKCESILYLLKKTKLTQRGALFPAGNFETMFMDNSTLTQTDFFDSMTSMALPDMIKAIIFGRDSRDKVKNNHVSAESFTSSLTYEHQYTNGASYTGNVAVKRDIYPVFGDKFNTSVSNLDFSTMNISDVTKSASGPNSMPLGPWQQVYFQYNEFALHDSTNLHYYYDDSARFWEKNFSLASSFNDGTKTGWDDTDAFGVLGLHPALNYSFIDSFGILFNIWKCIKNNVKAPMGADSAISKLTLSPYDKIIESVAGSATENATASKMGSNLNSFRPRAFVVLPQKFAADHPAASNALGAFQVFKSSATTVYDLLTSGTASLDYAVYTTPMGDLVVEPNWYDTHPLEHWPAGNKIVLRNTSKTAKVKAVLPDDNPQTSSNVQLKVHDYKDNNTHPYFIMLKDTGTFSQEFSPELIKTKIVVRGRQTDMSATHGVASGVMDTLNKPDLDPLWLATNSNAPLAPGFYIAHGFSAQLTNIMSSLTKFNGILSQRAYNDFNVYTTEQFFNQIASFTTLTFSEFYKLAFYSALTQNSQEIINFIKSAQTESSTSMNSNSVDAFPLGMDPSLAPLLSLYTFLYTNYAEMFNPSTPWVYGLSATDLLYLYQNAPECVANITSTDGNVNVDVSMFNFIPGGNYSYIDYSNKPVPCITELINLYKIGLLFGSTVAGDMESVSKARRLFQGASAKTTQIPNMAKSIRTMGDLKRLAVAGLYNPQLDVVRRYGYNTNATEIVQPYIRNGAEARFYARVIFLKLFSGAFTFHLGTIGRPEFLLNRTYYCQRKDAIGLLTKYSLGWTYGSESISDIDLTYIRKNAATFSYSLGDLDIISPKGNANNKSLQKDAEHYYAWQKLSSTLANKATSLASASATGLAGSMGIPAGAVIGDEIAGVVGSAISKVNIGGMYSVHPYIGHTDYDNSAVTKESPLTDNTASTINTVHSVYSAFYNISSVDTKEESQNFGASVAFGMLKQISEDIDNIQTECLKAYTSYLLKVQRLTKLPDEIAAATKGSAAYNNLQTELTTVKQVCTAHTMCISDEFTTLYGSASTYSNGMSEDYTSLIESQTQAMGANATPKEGLQKIQQALGITYDTIASQYNSMYYQYNKWLDYTTQSSPTKNAFQFIPDQVTATDPSSAIAFANDGTLSPVYYKLTSSGA